MKPYIEFAHENGPLYLLGADMKVSWCVAQGSATDTPAPPKTRFTHDGVTYETESAIPSGVALCADEDGPHTTLDKPLILRRV